MKADVWEQMVTAARAVARNAYAPASGFCVGAAVLADDGRIYPGCNVENVSYGLTICAERNAVAQAVAAGAREIRAVVVATPLEEPAAPCGACRQVLQEFAVRDGDLPVLLVGSGDARRELRLRDLLPEPFRFDKDAHNGGSS